MRCTCSTSACPYQNPLCTYGSTMLFRPGVCSAIVQATDSAADAVAVTVPINVYNIEYSYIIILTSTTRC